MKIEIGKRARHQVERASSWWAQHRPAAPTLFEDEFEEALGRLRMMPRLGVPYAVTRRPGLRRLLLPKTEYHVYFALEPNDQVLVVHAIWGARRRRPPAL